MARGRPQKTTRMQWIWAAAELMTEGGVTAVRVEAVAKRLGVTKGGFYGHFSDRHDFLTTLLQAWERVGTEAIITAVETSGGNAAERMEVLWRLAAADGIGPELAIRDWARHDEKARDVVQRVDNRRMQCLRDLFGELGFHGADAEARAMLFFSLLTGDHHIAATHRRFSRKRVLAECRKLLREPAVK